jgi:aryl-alcohol dehydrogenase-like predicted oxidoreductase
MRTRPIGSLHASVIGLGCNNFGGRLDLAGTKSVLDAAIDAGVTFLDTADIYGGTDSERFIGEALRGRRDEVLIATKFGHPRNTKAPADARPENVRAALESSLQRLGTDHVDLYQLHFPDPNVPIADTLGALGEAVAAGQVREIGCSNFTAEQLQEAEDAVKDGAPRFVSVQNEFSMLVRDPERSVLPTCERLGIAFLPYFPLLSGILTGKYRKGRPLPEGTRVTGSDRWEAMLTPEVLDLVEELIAFAEARGREIVDLAFAYLLAHRPVASVIAGATKPEQVRRNAQAGTWELTRDEFAAVRSMLDEADVRLPA